MAEKNTNASDGWTHVAHGRRKKPSEDPKKAINYATAADPPNHDAPRSRMTIKQDDLYYRLKNPHSTTKRPPRPAGPLLSVGRSLEEVFRLYHDLTAKYKKQRESRTGDILLRCLWHGVPDLRSTLASIDTAICIGLGTPSNTPSDDRNCVYWQLIVFLEIVRLIEHGFNETDVHGAASPFALDLDPNETKKEQPEQTQRTIKVYAQDPFFSAMDLTFLESLGIIVLQTPAAFELVSRSAFVFAPHVEPLVWSQSMRKGVPALMIANQIVVDPQTAGRRIVAIPLAENELIRAFAALAPSLALEEIPDLHAQMELRALAQGTSIETAFQFPEMNEYDVGMGSFNDLIVYVGKQAVDDDSDKTDP